MRDKTFKMLFVALLIGPAMTFVGCKSDGDGDEPTQPAVALAEPVAILQSSTGNSQALANVAGVRLIKTQADYDKLGDATIAPGINFDEQDLVLASLGQQNTGGYSVSITALQLEGDTLVVVGKAKRPGADDIVTQALTYPYAAAVIANTDAKLIVSAID